ncbi:MAG: hypothetical protein Ta2A_02660 [Treponemataceae bacterium]|nr:MAG: hypothetical protein Ta2A_02660 [Treponemataceae bacterium]
MKKNSIAAAAFCVAAFLSAGSVFAAPEFRTSVGVGAIFTADFTSHLNKTITKGLSDQRGSADILGGAGAWIDLTYAEVSLGISFGNQFSTYKDAPGASKFLGDASMKVDLLHGELLAKYPIALSDKVTFFPAVGIGFSIVLGRRYVGSGYPEILEKSLAEYNAMWSKGGVGADFALGRKLYLRTEALYGIRGNTQFEQRNDYDGGLKNADYYIIGHGLDVKIGLGIKL